VTDIAQELNAPQRAEDLGYAQLRQGTVQAINAGDNTASVYLSGDTTVLMPGVHFLDSFQPTVGDTVWFLKSSTDMIGIGKVATTTAGGYAQIQGIPFNNVILAGNTGFFNLSASPFQTNITKRYSTSNLFVNLAVTGYNDVASGTLQVAVNTNFTDYICGSITNDMIVDNGGDTQLRSSRGTATGSTVIPGLAAGVYTCTIRIRNPGGTGNLHVDGGDFYTMTVQEVL
jgi:hypothetical protein